MGLEINSVQDIKEILELFKGVSKAEIEIPGVIKLSIDNTSKRIEMTNEQKKIIKENKEKMSPEQFVELFAGTTEEFKL